MTARDRRSPRFAPVVLALGCALGALPFAAPWALAALPSPPNCSWEPVLVASWSGTPAAAGNVPCGPAAPGYDVVIRDINNVPIPDALVVLEFTGPSGYPHLLQNADITVLCSSRALVKATDPNGLARFAAPRVAGSDLASSVVVRVDNIVLGSVPLLSPDYNGDGALSLSDFATFSSDFLAVTPQPRSDFNNCPTQLLGDYAYFSSEYLLALGAPPAFLCPLP